MSTIIKILTAIVSTLLLIVVLFLWWGYQYYTPINLEKVQISPEELANWKTYTNLDLGFQIKYPLDYFLCVMPNSPVNYVSILFFKGGSVEDCSGSRKNGVDLIVNGNPAFELSTVDEYVAPKINEEKPPWKKFSCHSRTIAGDKAIICASVGGGESPEFTGKKFVGDLYLIHESVDKDKIFLRMSAGHLFTTYTGDHDLQEDFIRIPLTLQWLK